VNTKQLRQKILDLAIHGKLVPQDPADEPALALLERIRAEKEKLIREGKIKRDKKDSTIVHSADKSHYGKMPDGWAVVQIRDVCIINPRNTAVDTAAASFVPMAMVEDGFTNSFTFQEKLWGEIKSGFTHFQDGDIGLAKITPCLENRKSVVFRRLTNGIGAGTTELHVLRPICADIVLADYLLWFLKSEWFISGCIGAFSGAVGQQRVGKNYVVTTFIPLPPIAEQYRIIAAIKSTFAVINEIERNRTDLQTAVTATKSKILSLAIHGKLVPQDSSDEPASILLERIRTEREGLIKTGKIRHSKADSAIIRGGDNSYYGNLPDGWVLAQFDDVANIVMGQSPSGNSVTVEATGTEFHQGKIFFTERYLAHSGQYAKESNKIVDKESVLLCVRAPVGAVNITNRIIAIGRGLCSLSPLGGISVNFLFYWLTAFKKKFIEQATGTTFVAITTDIVKSQSVPIPPLAEQQRIVTAIEATFQQLKQIADSLS
jgi:type I restriction enzyme S subunit